MPRRLDTSDEWIRQRTGIGERRVAAEGELTSDLAVRAAERALADAGMSAGDLDLIVLATATPDNTFPATATKVQARLGMHRGAAFDVQAVCAGFIFALATADNALRLGQARTALVIGAETFSRILDWEDRGTCVLFGDGAGALVLQGGRRHRAGRPRRPVDPSAFGRAAIRHPLCRWRPVLDRSDRLSADGGPRGVPPGGAASRRSRRGSARRERARPRRISTGWCRIRRTAGSSTGSARRLGLPAAKIVSTIERHANTSAASIPLALATAVADGRIRPGHLVLMEALGGGLSWGASLVRW